jgi:hypothetical protein
MGYLIRSDYYKSMKEAQIVQITGGDNNILLQAEAAAMERAMGMLRQKYEIATEFTNTQLYSVNTVYNAADRVYINYPAYVATNSYVIGNYCTNGGSAYVCTTDTTGVFNAAHWANIGTSTSIYYAAFPHLPFNLYGNYVVGDKVFYNNKIYTALQATVRYSNISAVQFGYNDNIPFGNVYPNDSVNGSRGWTDNGAYTVPANLLATAAYNSATSYPVGAYAQFQGNIFVCIDNTTGQFDPSKWRIVWALGDNRSQLMLTSIVDIALWYVHRSIAPNNIPELRVDAYNVAIEYFRRVRDGVEQANLTLIQPQAGRRILADSRVIPNNYY